MTSSNYSTPLYHNCVRNDQCHSGICKYGVCIAPLRVGDNCNPTVAGISNCPDGLRCSTLSYTCVLQSHQPVSPCREAGDCSRYDRCIANTCVAAKQFGATCTPAGAGSPMADECADGLRCTGSSGQAHCLPRCLKKHESIFGCNQFNNNSTCLEIGESFGVCGFLSKSGAILPTLSMSVQADVEHDSRVTTIVAVSIALILSLVAVFVVRNVQKKRAIREERRRRRNWASEPPTTGQMPTMMMAESNNPSSTSINMVTEPAIIAVPEAAASAASIERSNSLLGGQANSQLWNLYPALQPVPNAIAASSSNSRLPIGGGSSFDLEQQLQSDNAAAMALKEEEEEGKAAAEQPRPLTRLPTYHDIFPVHPTSAMAPPSNVPDSKSLV